MIITADVSVRLLECLKGKGEEDFSRLISEGVVSASDDAAQYAQAVLAAKRSPLPAEASRAAAATTTTVVGSAENATAGKGDDDALVKKLVDMSKGLRDCVDDLLDERTKRKDESSTLTALFRDFALGGDLDCGLRLLEQTSSAAGAGSSEEEERMEAIVEDAKYLSHKLERTLHKAAAAGQTLGSGEDEDLRKAVKKLKKEIEERDRELRVLRGR